MEPQNEANIAPAALIPLRNKIDEIDHQILKLLAQRTMIVEEVALVKKSTGYGIRDFIRESELLQDRGKRAAESGLRTEVIESLFRVILWASRDKQAALGAEMPKEMDSKTIAFIGGNGGMGKLLSKMFKDFGHVIIVSDVDTPISNIEAVQLADVVIICVPIEQTANVIREIGPHCKSESLLLDITSTKIAPIDAMLEHSTCSVIGTHPLFGPTIHSLQGQRIAIVPARDNGNWKEWICTILKGRGLSILETSAEEHDQAMSIVQVLTHQTTEVLGRTIQQLNVDIRKTLDFTSPIYLMELLMTARHFAQSADLYASIQMNNPQTSQILTALQNAGEELRDIINSKDRAKFQSLFQKVHKHFGDFSEQALEQSSFLIDRLVERG